jgi:peptidoglycan/LPS O-acetylase OafA/YrhL
VLESVQSAALTFLPIAGGACAVVALVAGSYHLGRSFESWLSVLGLLSLGIYVVHFPFVEMWRGMPAWFLPVNVTVALVLASGITLALGRWRVTALLLLGEPWTRKPRPLGDVRTETL